MGLYEIAGAAVSYWLTSLGQNWMHRPDNLGNVHQMHI